MSLPQIPQPPEPPQPPQRPTPAPGACPLCDTGLDADQQRCPSCGLYQQLGPDRPNPFRQGGLWLLVGVLVAVYVLVLAIVAVLPPAR